ncbi:polysaccharide deacetylase family protein [Talaromyces proteolyticus]|uniref:Polysaccharide deacetylase family protein n=1 Tax=Talaromyces proteolyticus TaxID=1131652 RepID=A0AAD4KZP8_9EURO|nr:polysaccharide deacetylase family protein [Talaromyces proteolyticus]KAH8703574.1 polysaccharide deacetylase family protein [Talaromyces proteolyticus]
MGLIPARKAVAVQIRQDQIIKITNTHGKQVVDFWAFNPNDTHDFLSMVHTRTVLRKVSVRVGDAIVSTRRKPMITIEEDTTQGVHDIIWSACDAERYRMQGVKGHHDNCSENMHTALKETFPAFQIPDDWVPDPFNLFMNVAIDHHGGLDIRPPTSEKGQHVVLRAHSDLILVMSSCPQDIEQVNAGMPTDCEYDILTTLPGTGAIPTSENFGITSIPRSIDKFRHRKVKVALSFDFDAISHWLGTGCHPDNNMADYSSGIFAGRVGAIRLLNMLKKFQVADKVTWFIPGHTMETFPATVQQIVDSGAEIGLHGYAHEGIYQMTPAQEQDVLEKCIDVATKLCGKRPRGYRAPMYTIRETTVELLRKHEFLYDTSLMHHDSQPYFTPSDPPIEPIDFTKDASSWLHPTQLASSNRPPEGQIPLVEIPCGWYNEDMMPLQYLPHLANSNGYVSTRMVEQMWKDKFLWLWENSEDGNESTSFVFPILMHPDTSGMSHIIGMSERVLAWLKSWGASVQFSTHEDIAREWLAEQKLN